MKKVVLVTSIISIILCQMVFLFPEEAAAETAGSTLIVRVGYLGDDNDYRVKARLSNGTLSGLGKQTYYYTNVTRTQGIMTVVAKGPTMASVLSAAGIDYNSIQMIHLRTTDAGGKVNNWFMSYNKDAYLGRTRYYYPNLLGKWEDSTPQKGALSNSRQVPAILATVSKSGKDQNGANLQPQDMTSAESYRFCLGQTALQEMVPVSEADVVSNSSAQNIFGIDVQLYGHPSDAKKISIKQMDKNVTVGSSVKIAAKVKGNELFQDAVDQTLVWESSDEKIATVSSDGTVTIKKKGKVTITARTENGSLEKSIVLNAKESREGGGNEESEKDRGQGGTAKNSEKAGKAAAGKKKTKEVSGLKGKEVLVSQNEEIDTVQYQREDMAPEAEELAAQEADPRATFLAAYTAFIILAISVVRRIQRYFKEV